MFPGCTGVSDFDAVFRDKEGVPGYNVYIYIYYQYRKS